MEVNVVSPLGSFRDEEFYVVGNFSCENFYLPSSTQLFDSLGNFGVALVAVASVLSAATVYLAVDACGRLRWSGRVEEQLMAAGVMASDGSTGTTLAAAAATSLKINAWAVLSVYPIASLCSLAALALPRAQLLSEGLTQMSLTIGLYRLYVLLLELGRRDAAAATATKPPTLMALRVGPCCCWPCLPLPSWEMSEVNLSRLRLTVLQLPVVQGLIYCILLFMSAEAPIFATSYGVFLQPLVVTSILLAVYGLTVVTRSLQDIAPEARLHQRTAVTQMVLLFSKLQGFLIKSLAGTGLFPCSPPLTPHVYANATYDALMVIEMLMLCYAARLIYTTTPEDEDAEAAATATATMAHHGKATRATSSSSPAASSAQAAIGNGGGCCDSTTATLPSTVRIAALLPHQLVHHQQQQQQQQVVTRSEGS